MEKHWKIIENQSQSCGEASQSNRKVLEKQRKANEKALGKTMEQYGKSNEKAK